MSSLDRRRADTAGEVLSAVPTTASTTAAGLCARLRPEQVLWVEDGVSELISRVVRWLPPKRRAMLQAGPATIDLDGTDVECYGSRKEGIAYNYEVGLMPGQCRVNAMVLYPRP